ncbi:LCP family protein, partial [Escherichia coli]|nr:LCP family protein [Escherichia coli]
APEGIKINAEKDMSKNIDANIKKGEQVMDGKTLLQYARFRKDAEGDFGRIRRQQQVLEALKEQAIDVGDVAKIPDVIG